MNRDHFYQKYLIKVNNVVTIKLLLKSNEILSSDFNFHSLIV